MRNVTAASSVPLLLLIATGLLLPSGPAHAGKHRASKPGVVLSVDRRAYPPGIPVAIQVENRSRRTIYVPGCASFTLERFDESRDAFVPLAPKRCEWEENAIAVPPGKRVFTFDPPRRDERLILRAVLTYGTGCRDGVPLSRARCARVETAYSHAFIVLQAPAK